MSSLNTLSDEWTGLSFVYAAGPCQSSISWVRVPWDSRPCITVSDLRLPFSSPPTTRRVTVDVFDPASTRVLPSQLPCLLLITSRYGPHRKHSSPIVGSNCCIIKSMLPSNGNVSTEPLTRNCRCLQSRCLATGLYATILRRS
jgi:hypothetical protein